MHWGVKVCYNSSSQQVYMCFAWPHNQEILAKHWKELNTVDNCDPIYNVMQLIMNLLQLWLEQTIQSTTTNSTNNTNIRIFWHQVVLKFQWKQLFGKDTFSTFLLVACVLIYIHFWFYSSWVCLVSLLLL